MSKLNTMFFWVPNFITSLNLIFGIIAIFLGAQGYIEWAAWCIALAAVFDFLDGMAARLLKAYSDLGKQLDSLCDLVSFGLAPAAIMFSLLQYSLFGNTTPLLEINASPIEWLMLSSCLIIPIAGAFRLAKFNIDNRQSESFLGLPIPANALFFASIALVVAHSSSELALSIIQNKFNLIASILIISTMMISEIPMFSLKVKNFSWADNSIRYIFLILCIALIVTLKYIALPLIVISYIIISILTRNRK